VEPNPVPPAASPTPRGYGCGTLILLTCALGSLVALCVIAGTVRDVANRFDDSVKERELYSVGDGSDKVAVVTLSGVLLDGDDSLEKQLAAVRADDSVKAVVLRIDSPGGTISASDTIHKELLRLRDGAHPRHPGRAPVPLVASLGPIAASGGYYAAMAGEKVFAEPTTLTGSIGVFAALPNAKGLGDKLGLRLDLIKAGGIKASGSPFHDLSPAERQPWQDLVNDAYNRFLGVVATGRPGLTAEQLRNQEVSRKAVTLFDDKGNSRVGPDGKPLTEEVRRVRADGGTFTATQAKEYGLIDEIGELDDAASEAAKRAGLAGYRVVRFEVPRLFKAWPLAQGESSAALTRRLPQALVPRLWYLAPGADWRDWLPGSRARTQGRCLTEFMAVD
jgi:protease-4